MTHISKNPKNCSVGLANKMNQTRDWYRNVLNVRPEHEYSDINPNEDSGILSYRFGDEAHNVYVYLDSQKTDLTRPSTRLFNIDNLSDIRSRFKQLESNGQHNGELTEAPFSKGNKIILEDPCGSVLELSSDPLPENMTVRSCGGC